MVQERTELQIRTPRQPARVQHLRPAGGGGGAGAHAQRRRRARVVDHPEFGPAPKFILGGGSNLVLTRDVAAVVLKVEMPGRRLLRETPDAWIVEAGAGENWHDFVAWTLQQGWPGLENLALIPGTVGAAPVQNIGAYGVELKDRFDSLDAVDLVTGRSVTLDAAPVPSATATACSSTCWPARR